MRKILCLALPALLAAACGSDDGDKKYDARPALDTNPYRGEAAQDLASPDTTLPDTPQKLDLPVVLDGGIDGPVSPDLPPVIDAPPAIDEGTPAIDALPAIDMPPAIDVTPSVDSGSTTADAPQAIDV